MLPTDSASPLLINRIVLDGETVILEGQGAVETAACPACGASSASVHDRYVRRPLDLPWRGCVVRLVLTVRRFRCLTRSCPRRTFTEPFGPYLAGAGWIALMWGDEIVTSYLHFAGVGVHR